MNILNALKKGQSLKTPKFWKKAQAIATMLGTIIPAAVLLMPSLQVVVDKDMIGIIAGACGGLATYWNVATTEKLGA